MVSVPPAFVYIMFKPIGKIGRSFNVEGELEVRILIKEIIDCRQTICNSFSYFSHFRNIEISNRSALHLHQRPHNLCKGLSSNIPTMASLCTMLKDGILYYAKRQFVSYKVVPYTILAVISYHKVLVDGDLAKNTSRYWPPQRVLIDIDFVKDTDKCWPCKRSTGR